MTFLQMLAKLEACMVLLDSVKTEMNKNQLASWTEELDEVEMMLADYIVFFKVAWLEEE